MRLKHSAVFITVVNIVSILYKIMYCVISARNILLTDKMVRMYSIVNMHHCICICTLQSNILHYK